MKEPSSNSKSPLLTELEDLEALFTDLDESHESKAAVPILHDVVLTQQEQLQYPTAETIKSVSSTNAAQLASVEPPVPPIDPLKTEKEPHHHLGSSQEPGFMDMDFLDNRDPIEPLSVDDDEIDEVLADIMQEVMPLIEKKLKKKLKKRIQKMLATQ